MSGVDPAGALNISPATKACLSISMRCKWVTVVDWTFDRVKRVSRVTRRCVAGERERAAAGAGKHRVEMIGPVKRSVARGHGACGDAVIVYIENRVWLTRDRNRPDAIRREFSGQPQGVELSVRA